MQTPTTPATPATSLLDKFKKLAENAPAEIATGEQLVAGVPSLIEDIASVYAAKGMDLPADMALIKDAGNLIAKFFAGFPVS